MSTKTATVNADMVGEIVEKETGAELAKGKKVRIRLPIDKLNKEDEIGRAHV